AGNPVLDGAILLKVHTDAGDRQMTMSEYLPLALAGEMPAAFDSEALEAQAVALRSYALYYREHRKQNHPEADICSSSACCAALADEETLRTRWGDNYETYREKLQQAVRATDGQYLVWEEEPILAVFHAASGGRTEDGAALGLSLPYLVSVSSPETQDAVSTLNSTVEISAAEFRTTVRSAFPDAAMEPDGDPAGWLGATALNPAGRVESVEIGGERVSGLALRQLFSLRSTDFSLAWDPDASSFIFRVSGYGHGMGLSQHGANLMAKNGADYREILAHYYPGTELVMATA
ncbi:MAG: SpoIID/LytB domain-containing protein, partial [Oscillospiraceae bacterium]|nr:SpoIID/LytB domain-containing protein [Oscillospiraceae bacterium]